MKFVIIFGPPAVGKMTVAYELVKLTDLKVFHNHMTIDLVLNYFNFGDPSFSALTSEFRKRIFEEVAKSAMPGIIFTYVWSLAEESDKQFIDECSEIFRRSGGEVFFVELEATQSERLKRNRSEFRLQNKPSKRNLENSDKHLLQLDQTYKLNSGSDFFYDKNYLKIESTDLTASEVAEKIVLTFNWKNSEIVS